MQKKTKRNVLIAVGVCCAVVIVAGIGLFAWHNQPSFCGAICHTPMDNYLETFESGLHQEATDKWGNEVEDSSSMLAPVHAALGDGCLDCHESNLGEQISEGMSWVSGGYQYPLTEKTLTELNAASGQTSDEFCLNESCHNLTRDDLVELTADYGVYNPHDAHHTTLECGTCHKAHRASVMYCTQCHAIATVPEGWLTMGEAAELDSGQIVEADNAQTTA